MELYESQFNNIAIRSADCPITAFIVPVAEVIVVVVVVGVVVVDVVVEVVEWGENIT